MKKTLAQILFLAVLIAPVAAASPSATLSADLNRLPAVHLLPDNPLYFIKTLKEKAQLLITRNAKSQADLLLGFSQERLAEAVEVAEKGKIHIGEKLLVAYGEDLEKAQTAIETAKAAGEQTHNLLIKLKQTTDYYQSVLNRVGAGVPEGVVLVEQKSDRIGFPVGDWLRSLFGRRGFLKPLAE